ncbi:hypothetical protein [Arthrobacter sp. zg-Y750]|uniref:hypothetical protein n=1 Tax=Arthrobacter sp. zg-Y750 TaxID=2894189 RepID=UPI001E5C489E|nr:hypothetical protein [Arthrobacter sp. zg-Y750]MCC9176114.1 hypothetical protein [Arthrobacter sp. zg-Y750]
MPGIDSRQATGVGAVSVFAALSGFLILVVAARSLTASANADFLAFWGALFAVYGILNGIAAESTRAVGRSLLAPAGTPRGGSITASALITGTVLAVAVAAVTVPFSIGGSGQQWTIVGILLATSLVFAVHAALSGALQAMDQWHPYSKLVLLEAGLRLAAVTGAAGLGLGLQGLEAACLAALLAWPALVLFSPAARAGLRAHGDVRLGLLLRGTAQACVSAAASAALVVSYPLLVKVTTPPEDFATAAPVLLAISLTRAPIMLPLVAFQGLAINAVLRAEDGKGWKALSRPILAVLALGGAGAVLAWWAGPWLMTFFGDDYRIQGWVLAALTVATAGIAVLTLSGMALLATGRHRAYTAGWLTASVLAFLILLLPFSTEVRCVLSLLIGPLAGVAIHFRALTKVRKPAL